MGKFFRSLKRAAREFMDDDCMSSGAAISYYAIFSLPPFLVMLAAIAGYFGVSWERINQVVESQWGVQSSAATAESGGLAGGEEGASGGAASANQEGGAAQGAGDNRSGSLGMVSRIAGIAFLVFSATGLFAQLQYALNRAWEVEPDPKQGGALSFIFKRVLSLGMILVVAFLLLISLVMTTVIDEVIALFQGGAPDTMTIGIGIALNNAAAFLVATLLFAAMFKVLPDAKMSWRDVWVGAAITALLFVIGKSAIGWYLQSSDMGAGWGAAAASLIGVLVWIYYSSLILLFGAEVTQVWASEFGRGIEPAEGAVKTERTKRIKRDSPQTDRPHRKGRLNWLRQSSG